MASPTVDASDRRIARVERLLDLSAMSFGLLPTGRISVQPPSRPVGAGIALLGAGPLRDMPFRFGGQP